MTTACVRYCCAAFLCAFCFTGCSTAPVQHGAITPAESNQRSSDLVGAWRPVELAIRTGAGEWEIRPVPQAGLYVFSRQHYSYLYIPGGRQRPQFGNANTPTEAERAAAYDTFIAGAGSYSFDGSVLEVRADLRKNPNEMTGLPWHWKVDMLRGDTARFIFSNPPFLPGRDWRTTLVRVE